MHLRNKSGLITCNQVGVIVLTQAWSPVVGGGLVYTAVLEETSAASGKGGTLRSGMLPL